MSKNWGNSYKDMKTFNSSHQRLKFEVAFHGKGLNQSIHFAALMSKSNLNFLGAIMIYQRFSESETRHEIEVRPYAEDRMESSKT